MIFGLTLTKFAMVLALAVLLFGVPLMSLIITLRERGKDRSRKGEFRWRR